MCRSSSAASRRACGASRTSTTGRRRCAARSCSMPRRTCWCYGNAERADRRDRASPGGRRERSQSITDIRGTAFVRKALPHGLGTRSIPARIDTPGPLNPPVDPYAMERLGDRERTARGRDPRHRSPASATVRSQPCRCRMRDARAQRDPHAAYRAGRATIRRSTRTRRASCTWRSNPGNARALVQRHGDADVWLNPPPIPLTTPEMDALYELPYSRRPHPCYGDAKIPAYEMIRFSVAIQRGCFGGCTFCSITEHEGRIIQSRSEDSVLREIETIRDTRAGLHRRHLRSRRADGQHVPARVQEPRDRIRVPAAVVRVSRQCARTSNTDHAPLIQLYRKRARAARHQEGADRVGRALRPGDRIAGVREGTGAAPHRRLSEDRARGDRRGAAVEDDEARRGRLLQVQRAVRPLLEGSGQGAIPDPVFHRGASRHHGRGHARARAVAQARTAIAPTRCRRSCPRRWRPPRRCTTRARIRCGESRAPARTCTFPRG